MTIAWVDGLVLNADDIDHNQPPPDGTIYTDKDGERWFYSHGWCYLSQDSAFAPVLWSLMDVVAPLTINTLPR